MNVDNIVVLTTYTIVIVLAMFFLRRIKRANPVFWFLLFQWIIASGTIIMLDLSLPSDIQYTFILFLAIFSFIFGAAISMSHFDIQKRYSLFYTSPIEKDSQTSRMIVVFLAFFSFAITLIYYNAVGYNLLVDIVMGHDILDFKSARLAAYSGENYYAPGIVNQFKNLLLPVCLYVIAAWLWLSGKKVSFRLAVLFIVPILLYSLLGTGQRAPLLYSFLALLFGISTIAKIKIMKLVLVSVLIILIFGLFSVMNGRIQEFETIEIIFQLLGRIFINEQEEGIWGFRYVIEQDFPWFSDWGQGILGILPGHKGSYLAHHLYYLIHGTDRGTSAITTVASSYYNGGLITVFLFYMFLGWGYMYLFGRFLSGKRTVLRCFSYGGLFFILSVFVSGPPVVLLNKGVLALMLLLFVRKFRFYSIKTSGIAAHV